MKEFSHRHIKVGVLSYLSACIIVILARPAAIFHLTDDSYYYIMIAKNIAAGKGSVFTSGIPTNGYHPVWELILSTVALFGDLNVNTVITLQLIISCVTIFALLKTIKPKSPTESLFAVSVLAVTLQSYCLRGMETDIFTMFLSILLLSLYAGDSTEQGPRAALAAITAVSAVGSRIDSIVFIIPLIALSPRIATVKKIGIIIFIFLVGCAYAALNYVFFGSALPVSGLVKSLGGIQINEMFLRQTLGWANMKGLTQIFGPTTLGSPVKWTLPYIIILALDQRKFFTRRLAAETRSIGLAALSGGGVYLARIVFASSWKVWPW